MNSPAQQAILCCLSSGILLINAAAADECPSERNDRQPERPEQAPDVKSVFISMCSLLLIGLLGVVIFSMRRRSRKEI